MKVVVKKPYFDGAARREPGEVVEVPGRTMPPWAAPLKEAKVIREQAAIAAAEKPTEIKPDA